MSFTSGSPQEVKNLLIPPLPTVTVSCAKLNECPVFPSQFFCLQHPNAASHTFLCPRLNEPFLTNRFFLSRLCRSQWSVISVWFPAAWMNQILWCSPSAACPLNIASFLQVFAVSSPAFLNPWNQTHSWDGMYLAQCHLCTCGPGLLREKNSCHCFELPHSPC